MITKTLVCLDGSKVAEEALPFAIDFSLACRAEVILFRVTLGGITIPPPESIHTYTLGTRFKPVNTPTSDIGKDSTLEPRADLELKIIEKVQDEVKRYLNDLAKKYQMTGLKLKTVVAEGDAGRTILSYAESNKVSLIALTPHGSGGCKSSFGRVAQFILKESTIPVLVVKCGGK
jgi:nucleotide-binding universal stress UspA family protein